MKNILKTMSFLGCSLAVLGSPVAEASEVPASVEASTVYKVQASDINRENLLLTSRGITSIDTSELSEEDLSKIKYCFLFRNKLTSESLKGLSALSNLKELYLSRNQIVSLSELPALESLEVLELGDNQLTSEGLDKFPNLPNLKELEVCGNENITKDDIIKLASKFPRCRICNSTYVVIPPVTMDDVVDLSSRRIALLDPKAVVLSEAELLLTNDRELTSLEELTKFSLPALKYLTIMNSKIESLNAESIKSWPNLRSLRISSETMENLDVSCLSSLKQLTLLDLSWNERLRTLTGLASLANLEYLSVAYTNINPNELYKQLSGLGKLEYLLLDGTTVDTKLLGESLAQPTKLKVLQIQYYWKRPKGTPIPQQEIIALSQKLSNCEITSEHGIYNNGEKK